MQTPSFLELPRDNIGDPRPRSPNGSGISRPKCSTVLMAYLIKWFRFQSFCGITLTAFFWIFLCYQVLPKEVIIDENNAFNLVEDNFSVEKNAIVGFNF